MRFLDHAGRRCPITPRAAGAPLGAIISLARPLSACHEQSRQVDTFGDAIVFHHAFIDAFGKPGHTKMVTPGKQVARSCGPWLDQSAVRVGDI